MEIKGCIQQLRLQRDMIISLIAAVPKSIVRWKPNQDNWSILEVLNHLVDEEILDFREHLNHILHKPDQPWTIIDPQGWVTEKGYQERELEQTLENFRQARNESIQRLSTQTNPDWFASFERPWGLITAGDMMASWLAHDLLHARQIIELCYQHTLYESDPFRVEYAGEW